MTVTRARWLPKVLLYAAVWLLPPLVIKDTFVMHLLVLAGIFAVLATGLNLVMGYSGLLSLGHHAFFGLGAYASALSAAAGLPLLLAIVAGGAAGLVASRLIGAILLKLRSAFFVIATIAFAEILRVTSLNWIPVTNGPMGIAGIPPLRIVLPFFEFQFNTPHRAYYFIWAVVGLTVVVVRYLVASPMGVGLVAMRESEYVARSLGIDTARLALRSVVIGSTIAGVAGALYGHYVQFVSPDVLTFGVMITLVVMVLGGGMGTLWGPVLGAVIFTLGPEFLRAGDQYRLLVYGLIIVLLVRFLPNGLWGTAQDLVRKARRRRGADGEPAAAHGPSNPLEGAGDVGGSPRSEPVGSQARSQGHAG
jgi:branched-chain amino acid transport system permease protein